MKNQSKGSLILIEKVKCDVTVRISLKSVVLFSLLRSVLNLCRGFIENCSTNGQLCGHQFFQAACLQYTVMSQGRRHGFFFTSDLLTDNSATDTVCSTRDYSGCDSN